ncbi:MAG TPA: prepilin-type N-terminal cleavage/methylation domain-containing protein [Pseudomonas sp.]|uniref:PilW family protein n=1 Tax=Pseudomonas sp. TaxID=306 RepID=UPI002B47329E|nr:prepilin-type N-terminal cleavage/methylation domain-containing protein [Pseudomonas sp.]HKS13263.1 prepilin-type N-terminal cleavage/methylation domain-containing protein [Pseudomonas sp.]
MRAQQGFGLLEVSLALALGLLLLVAGGHVLVSAHQSWQLQHASARLQEDARLVLQRLAQDLRMTGMFGCLHLEDDDYRAPGAALAFAKPLRITHDAEGRLLSLELVGGQLAGESGKPDWMLVTDCSTWAQVRDKDHAPGSHELIFPIRRQVYRLEGDRLLMTGGGRTAALIEQVRDMRVARGHVGEYERLQVQLTLFDPLQRIEQRYDMHVTLRNRMPHP